MSSETIAGPGTPAAYWSVAGLAEGARLVLPAMPVMGLFAFAFGTFAVQKGLDLSVTTLMSAIMFAGASQFVEAEAWGTSQSLPGILTLVMFTAMVNLRFLLMSASMRPWLGGLPAWQSYPALAVLTEPGWLIGLRYRASGGADAAIVLGGGIAFWLIWVIGTQAGFLFGMFFSDPKRFGIDLVMPLFFIVVLVPLWRGPRRATPWAVAGIVALLAAEFIPGQWYIMAGAIAGCVTGGFIDERA